MASSVAIPKNPPTENEDTVDREKKCPLLLRVFISTNGRHHHMADYSRGSVPSKEVQIYTWMDASLKELTALVKEVNPDSRKPGTRFDFALVFPDMRTPVYRLREIGTTVNGRKDPNDLKTLAQSRFQVGDFLDVAIQMNNNSSADGPRYSGGGDRGGMGPNSNRMGFNGRDRERDFGRYRGRPY